MWPGGTPGTLGETKVGGTWPNLASTAAVSATRDMAIDTAATVDPAATRSIWPTSMRASSGGTWLSMATSATSDRIRPDEWERLPIAALAWDETVTTLRPRALASSAMSIGAAFRPP